jgi:hypothetical protein
MNREQRRHPEKTLRPEPPAADTAPPKAPEDELRARSRVQDDLSVRAKSSGHGKKTADKWNQ